MNDGQVYDLKIGSLLGGWLLWWGVLGKYAYLGSQHSIASHNDGDRERETDDERVVPASIAILCCWQ